MLAMNRLVSAALTAACVTASHAAGFYGSLTVDGQLPTRSIDMKLICGGQEVASATADRRGSYQFGFDQMARNCFVQVEGARLQVVIYANPTRYDFALNHPGGNAQLTRR